MQVPAEDGATGGIDLAAPVPEPGSRWGLRCCALVGAAVLLLGMPRLAPFAHAASATVLPQRILGTSRVTSQNIPSRPVARGGPGAPLQPIAIARDVGSAKEGWWPHAPTHADSGVAAHPGLSHNGAAAVLLTPGAAFAATGAAAAPTVLPAGLVASGIAVVLAGAVAFIGYRFVTAPPDDQAASSANAEHQGTATDGTQDTRQLLGLPAAAVDRSRPLWQVRLQLTKPMAWMPLICGVAAGAAASGNFHWTDPSDVLKVLIAMFMSGPLLAGYTQTVNDWYDREIDAINEPNRPIPSGLITENQVIAQIWALLLSGVAVAAGLDWWAGHWFDGVSGVFIGPMQVPPIVANALFGAVVAYIYSAPPLKLKQSGWIGVFACGASYIALPWWCGQSLLGELTPDVMILTVAYSIAGLGIAIINDFKSMEGDRKMGLRSMTVMFGVERAKWLCTGLIDATQLGVALYLALHGEPGWALAVSGALVPQVWYQAQYFLQDPLQFDVKYLLGAEPFFVVGLLCTALAIGQRSVVVM